MRYNDKFLDKKTETRINLILNLRSVGERLLSEIRYPFYSDRILTRFLAVNCACLVRAATRKNT